LRKVFTTVRLHPADGNSADLTFPELNFSVLS